MIQWFPGHMAKALREIQEKQSLADLFIVVLDARAPLSSYNEEFDKIAPSKPRLFVITKSDLADNSKLDKVKNHFNHQNDSVLIVNLKKSSSKTKIMKEAEKLLASKRKRDIKKGMLKPRLRAIVVGVPNSGKSTLINSLASKAKTMVGNMPGVTKGQQWVNTGLIQLLDTPGILWPKFKDELTGVKLAIIGSIKLDVIPQQELFNATYKLISSFYPNILSKMNLIATTKDEEIYSELIKFAKMKNMYETNNKPNLVRARKQFIDKIRNIKGVTYD